MNVDNIKVWSRTSILQTYQRLTAVYIVNVHITHRMSRVTDIVNVRQKSQPETTSSHRMGDYDSNMVDALALIVN